VALKDLATATYDIRITYSNPSDQESRVTLLSDGVPRAPGDHPYFIPAFLPPTGKGQFRTVSFLWSLYSGTTHLSLQWRAWPDKAKPEWNDKGSALIDAIELVKVEPVVVPQARQGPYPDLVAVPGGEFTMGSKDGEPDEAPPHKVRISPLAVGRFEVTNEDYERFDPAHRKFRDGFSWRDREPVIYVSWVNAAQYCNWLSRQAGLTPVYQEQADQKSKQRTWQADPAAEGFRLPTEAEWEYAASGRGEGRKYPWGNQPPDATRGNMSDARELRPTADIHGEEAAGTMVVGSYPAGASRDGIMDLAGNVSEWCSDWFNPYFAEEQSDPISRTPSNYRSIRGGSWGYYGLGQRCSDREYNNPGYGGYVYIGFRVALSEAGWKKLQGKQFPKGTQ
jgi:formylglycine-generating enzyme required for sulfatase activity